MTEKLSLRDPAGSLFDIDGRLIRAVNSDSLPHLNASLESPSFVAFQETGKLASTRVLSGEESTRFRDLLSRAGLPTDDIGKLLEHDRVPFTSFPYEWSPEMLAAAAALTLELAERLLPEGMGIKDATPYNVLFKGSQPVFVDILSLEKRIKGDPTWLPFAQFTRTFLNPLLAYRYFGLTPSMVFLARREGLDASDIYALTPFWKRMSRPFFSLATVPHLLSKMSTSKKVRRELTLLKPEKARFIINSLFKHLRRLLVQVSPQPRRSRWAVYMTETLPYDKSQFSVKEDFVTRVLRELKPKRVLDVGANTGHFSRLAAREKCSVVAIDSDPQVVDENFRQSRKGNLDVLPLVVSFASPSPAVGWRNAETKSFLQRARGNFDLVMMLAVIHHLNIDEGIPITEILASAAELTKEYLLVEFVGPEDISVKDLIQHRRPKEVLTSERFESKAGFYFDIIIRERIAGSDRVLYLLKKKSGIQNIHSI